MATTAAAKSPFSFEELFAQQHAEPDDDAILPATVTVTASDGVALAVHVYAPPDASAATASATATALVFYHGGGAHAGAGYEAFARGLAARGTVLYLPDLRGHGASGGPRGDAPSKEQVWRDVDAVLAHAAATHPGGRVVLGGHSSGGGLVVNYATHGDAAGGAGAGAAAYVLVAPELGYRSGTARPGRTDFATVNVPAFLAHGLFGILGHSRAVRFRYPPALLADDPGMVGFNTVHVANAITPERPREQLMQMRAARGSDGRPPPLGLWIGADDELLDAGRVADLVATAAGDDDGGDVVAEVLPGKNHLGILVDVHERIGSWLDGLRLRD